VVTQTGQKLSTAHFRFMSNHHFGVRTSDPAHFGPRSQDASSDRENAETGDAEQRRAREFQASIKLLYRKHRDWPERTYDIHGQRRCPRDPELKCARGASSRQAETAASDSGTSLGLLEAATPRYRRAQLKSGDRPIGSNHKRNR